MGEDDPGGLSDRERLERLERRLAEARRRQAPPPRLEEHFSGAQVAWRMVIELVAGVAIGAGMGLGLDWLFGSEPIFLALFSLLGFAAGVKTVMSTAQEVQERAARAAARDEVGAPEGQGRGGGDEDGALPKAGRRAAERGGAHGDRV